MNWKMKRKMIGMVALCFVATFLNAAQDGKEALESFKKYLAAAQAEWDCTVNEVKKVKRYILAVEDTNVPMQTFDVQTNCQFSALAANKRYAAAVASLRTDMQEDCTSIPDKLDKAKTIAHYILRDLGESQDKLGKTKVSPGLVRERDALLAQSRSFGEVLDSYIKQDVRAATDKILDDIRRNADDHISDSDRPWSPVAISLLPSIQWPMADADVTGLRLNVLAGKHHNVYGVDVAIIENVVSDCAAGIQLAGLINYSDTVYGYQLAALHNSAIELVGGAQISYANINKCYGSWLQVGVGNCSGFFEGAQIAGLVNLAYSCKGLQIGSFNIAEELSGFQVGVANVAQELSGFQIGVANGARRMSGFQISVYNGAEEMSGFQIGVLNLAEGLSGFQIGVFNVAGTWKTWKAGGLSGFQIGVLNIAEKANGLQVGVLNYIEDATCSFLPLINMQF